jgi:hypothetical protein
MALLFIDGFDHYLGNPSAFNKWDIGNNDGAKTNYKRTGNNSLYVSPYCTCVKTIFYNNSRK